MRTYDIYFQPTDVDAQANGAKPFGFGYAASVGVAGLPKLVNRWLKCLLTTRGSDVTRPDYGTEFNLLLQSNISSLEDVVDAVTLAIDACNQQIKALDRAATTPPDERLQSALLVEGVPAGESGFALRVQLRSMANATTTLSLPTLVL